MLKGSVTITEKDVPAPDRILTAAVVTTVLPDGNPATVVAVRAGVREEVVVAVAFEVTAK